MGSLSVQPSLFDMFFEEFLSQVSYFVLFVFFSLFLFVWNVFWGVYFTGFLFRSIFVYVAALLPIIFFVDFLSFISHHILSRISFFTCSWEVSFTSFTNLFLSMLPILSLWTFFHQFLFFPSYPIQSRLEFLLLVSFVFPSHPSSCLPVWHVLRGVSLTGSQFLSIFHNLIFPFLSFLPDPAIFAVYGKQRLGRSFSGIPSTPHGFG